MADHVGIGVEPHAVEEGRKADADDRLADALLLEGVLGEEVHRVLGELVELLEVFLGLQAQEGNDDGAQGVADLEGAMTADADGGAAVLAGSQGLGQDVDTVHAAHAALVVDVQGVIVVEAERPRRAAGDDVVDHPLAAVLCDVRLDAVLIDLHVVAPGPDDGEVAPVDGVGAVVGAAGELELPFVGKRRTVHVVDELVDEPPVRLDLVVAGMLATGMADAACRAAQTGTGAAHVEADLVEFVEGRLHVGGVAALEHDVAALAVEGDEAAVFFPDVAELAQDLGVVMHAGRGHHT